jgi:hypothetical protein
MEEQIYQLKNSTSNEDGDKMDTDTKKHISEIAKKYEDWHSAHPDESKETYEAKIKEYYSKKPIAIFLDLDGTILQHAHHFQSYEDVKSILLPGTLKKINEWISLGHQIIITTARREENRAVLEENLRHLGIHWDKLIMDVSKGARIIINDKLQDSDPDRAIGLNVITEVPPTTARSPLIVPPVYTPPVTPKLPVIGAESAVVVNAQEVRSLYTARDTYVDPGLVPASGLGNPCGSPAAAPIPPTTPAPPPGTYKKVAPPAKSTASALPPPEAPPYSWFHSSVIAVAPVLNVTSAYPPAPPVPPFPAPPAPQARTIYVAPAGRAHVPVGPDPPVTPV